MVSKRRQVQLKLKQNRGNPITNDTNSSGSSDSCMPTPETALEPEPGPEPEAPCHSLTTKEGLNDGEKTPEELSLTTKEGLNDGEKTPEELSLTTKEGLNDDEKTPEEHPSADTPDKKLSNLSDEVSQIKIKNFALEREIAELRNRSCDFESRYLQFKNEISQLGNAMDDEPGMEGSPLLRYRAIFIPDREKAFLEYMCNKQDNSNAALTRSKSESLKWLGQDSVAVITPFARALVDGRIAEADSIMFCDRRPIKDLKAFRSLYGLDPWLIQEIASNGYSNILRILDKSGQMNYQRRHLAEHQQELFDKIVRLSNSREFCRANQYRNTFQ